MNEQLRYPGPWRHPIPLHPSFVQPLTYQPMQPGQGGFTSKLTLIFTQREQQWWVASDRRMANARLALGSIYKAGTLKPDPDCCELLDANDLEAAHELLLEHHSLPKEWPAWRHSNQPRLLAAQAWVDWMWMRNHHPLGEQLPPRSVAWWAEVYQIQASSRTLERAKIILRQASHPLVNVLWEGHLGFAPALNFLKLCPNKHKQKSLINSFDGTQAFSEALAQGRLPIDGMLAIRLDYAIRQVLGFEDATDAMVFQSIQIALNEWRKANPEDLDPIPPTSQRIRRKRGRRPSTKAADGPRASHQQKN